MTDILILMAALVVAMVWVGFQQRRLTTTLKRLERVEKRLHSAKLTLAATKKEVNGCLGENQLLKEVLTDVAKGEAHVWIEDGEVRATRTASRETPIH
jgi:uncharacterized membrane-anchored protein YhcB (DUF1043 family)